MKCISPASPGQPFFLRLQVGSFTEASLHLSKRKNNTNCFELCRQQGNYFRKNESWTFKSKTRLSPQF